MRREIYNQTKNYLILHFSFKFLIHKSVTLKRSQIYTHAFEKDQIFSYFWTNLGPILVELIFEHILLPQSSKARLFEFRTEIVINHIKIDKCRTQDTRLGPFSIYWKD